MYVTAHLVRSSDGGEGINSFLHLHGTDFSWPADPAPLADTEPGRTVLRRTDLPPGGNAVRAYLDILAPDGTSRRKLDRALTALARDLEERRNPTVFTRDDVTIRFGVEPGLELVREQHLQMLISSVHSLMQQHARK